MRKIFISGSTFRLAIDAGDLSPYLTLTRDLDPIDVLTGRHLFKSLFLLVFLLDVLLVVFNDTD